MKTRNLLMGAALALLAPLTILNVGCGDEPTPTDTDAGQVATDGGTTEGDDAGTNGGNDAGTQNDAGTETDGGTKPGDVELPGDSRIWFSFDFNENNKYDLGRHDLPAAETVTIADTGAVEDFDVSSDGQWVALATAKDQTGRADLWVMRGDGSGLKKLQEAPGTGDQDITIVDLSPDGNWVAFRGDLEVNNHNDIYVAPVAGGERVRLSPDRNASWPDLTQLSTSSFVWSPDSKYLVFTAELNENRKYELYIADLTASPPTVAKGLAVGDIGDISADTTSSTYGAQSQVGFTTDGRVVFRARLAGEAGYSLYTVKPDGTDRQPVAQAPTDIRTFAVSPDRTMLVYATPRDGANENSGVELYVLKLDGSAAPTLISTGTAADGASPVFSSLTWSPDNTMVAFVGDYTTDQKNEPFVAPIAGGGMKRLVAIAGGDSQDAESYIAWSPDSSAIAFAADHRAGNDIEVFRTNNVTDADQTPVLVQGVPSGGDANRANIYWTP